MVRKARELVEAKGILSAANPKSGKMLGDDTVKLGSGFYEHDEISSCFPEKTIFCICERTWKNTS
jgi:hypothetical protein